MKLTTKEEFIVLKNRKKIKTKDIAEALNISTSLISQYENHDAKMSLENIRKYRQYIKNH